MLIVLAEKVTLVPPGKYLGPLEVNFVLAVVTDQDESMKLGNGI